MIGNNKFKTFNNIFGNLNRKNLWRDKFWITFDGNTKNMYIYEVATSQLHQIIPFPYYNVSAIKCNEDQSSFIAYDEVGHKGYVIERV